MPSKGARSILKNTGQLAGARFIGIAIRFVYVLFLARLLAPELYGQYVALQAFYISFLALAHFGTAQVLQRRLARESDREAVLGECHAVNIVLTLTATAACALAGVMTEPSGRGRELLLILALALAGRGISNWADMVFIAHERARGIMGQEGLFRPLEVALGIALLFLGAGIYGVVILHAAIWWLQAARGLWLVRRQFEDPPPRWEPSRLWLTLAECARFGFVAVMHAWTMQLPMILARHSSLAPAELGQVALAYQVFQVAVVFPTALGSSSLPVVSRSVVRGDDNVFRYLRVTTAFGLVAGALLILLADILGPPVVPLVFGAGYERAGTLVAWAAAALVMVLLMTPFGVVRTAHGLTRLTYWMGPLRIAVLGATWLAVPDSLAVERPFIALLASQFAGAVIAGVNLRGLIPLAAVRPLVWPLLAAVASIAVYFVLLRFGTAAATAGALVVLAPCGPYLLAKSPELKAMVAARLPGWLRPRNGKDEGPEA